MTPPKETSNGAALELVNDAYLYGDDVSDQWRYWGLQYKCDVRSWLDTLTAKIREVKAQLDENIASELGENNAIRIADRVYRAQQGGTWKVQPERARDGSLERYLGDDWPKVVNLAAAGACTKTRLEALAKERAEADGFQPRDAARMVLDTFMAREPSGGPLTVLPIDKATKPMQRLEDGQTLYPPKRKELGE